MHSFNGTHYIQSTQYTGLPVTFSGMNLTAKPDQQSTRNEFNDAIPENIKKMIWKLYQSSINEKRETEIVDLKQCMDKVERIIKINKPSYENLEPLGSVEENPAAYFTRTKSLHAILREIFFVKVNKKGYFEIVNNKFDKNLDQAEKAIVQIFERLFNRHLKQGELEEALKAAKSIRAIEQGTVALLTLATIYLNQRNSNISAPLEAIADMALKSKNIQFFLSQIKQGEDEKLSLLIDSLKKIKNATVRRKMANQLIEKKLNEDNQDIANLIDLIDDNDAKTQAYIKIVKFFIEKAKIPEALEIIPKIKDNLERNKQYALIIDWHLDKKTSLASNNAILSELKRIILLIDDTYTRDKHKIKLFDYL